MFGFAFTQGSTRNVILVGDWAFKIPRFVEWRLFLYGLLANMQESLFAKSADFPDLCPVLWSIPGGLLVCMRRADPMPYEQWENMKPKQWLADRNCAVICEGKLDCFGVLEGKPVIVDYGCGV